MPYLLMFDLDGTLLSGSAGRRALRRVFLELYQVPDADEGVPMAGRTDLDILRDLATRVRDRVVDLEQIRSHYLKLLAEEVQRDPGRPCPGVPELLNLVRADPRFRLALGTGNLESGARIKLGPHNLNRYFPTGGFGSDAVERPQLIAAGVSRAAAYYGCDFAQTVVIGDTPLDVACGKANGLATVAVATGKYDVGQLGETGADAVLRSFVDVATAWQTIAAVADRTL